MISDASIVYVFDGRGGTGQAFAQLVQALAHAVDGLVPLSEDRPELDAFEALAVDAEFHAAEAVQGIRLERLFPQHIDTEFDPRGDAREAMVRDRATAVARACAVVWRDVHDKDALVGVREGHVQAWLQTLGALRVTWHADLSGSAQRLATASPEQIRAEPVTAAIVDWLAYLTEALLASRAACLAAGVGIDPEELEEWQ